MKKFSYKDYNKQIITRDNGNVQSHDKEESKLNSTITANSGAHTLLTNISLQALSNRYNGADVMFLFKDGLSLIINRLSFNSSENLSFSLVRIVKSS